MTLLIKFRESFILNPEYHSWCWAKVKPGIVNGEFATKYKRLRDGEAEKIIREQGLVCVERDKTMQIWDTPERDFQRTFKNRIKVTNLCRG